jgi:hypothetical protein
MHQNLTADMNTDDYDFDEEEEQFPSNHLSHPPMECMKRWALEHGLWWPGCEMWRERTP